jgi:uncharacterized protein (DUF1499 family)
VRVARGIVTVVIATVTALVVLGLGLRIYLGREVEDHLTAGEAVSITDLRSPLPQPSFLACPPHYCTAAEAVASPMFNLPWDRLRQYWIEVIAGQPRVVSVRPNEDPVRLVYIQHSPVFRFPDIITVEFVPLGPNRSSVAIFSRSRYGKYDFAKNRKRVEKWLVLLQSVARPVTQRPGGASSAVD